jgi:hypothetical protein
MAKKDDPFGFDMSVSSAKKKNPRGRRGMTGESSTSTRTCQHQGCTEAHVREYNLKWNFFNGTTEAELNAQMTSDKVWERETKPMKDPEAAAWARLGIEDPHQVLGVNATRNPGKNGGAQRRLPPTERRAVELLEVRDNMTKPEIRKAYKKLIKVLHPDMNGGDRSQEEQLQVLVWAWDQIKESRNFKD